VFHHMSCWCVAFLILLCGCEKREESDAKILRAFATSRESGEDIDLAYYILYRRNHGDYNKALIDIGEIKKDSDPNILEALAIIKIQWIKDENYLPRPTTDIQDAFNAYWLAAEGDPEIADRLGGIYIAGLHGLPSSIPIGTCLRKFLSENLPMRGVQNCRSLH
jgi:hypothetical protein